MLGVLGNSWALLLGMLLLMVGNGLQGSLLGVRGAEAGFSSGTMSIVMSAYFAGFLFASKMAPELIRRVGHVRVFAALGSFISAVLILFPALQHPAAWVLGRLVLGFCFCGVYVTAESWLNNTASNETRGQTLSAYMIVQMAGIIIAQGLLLVPDVSGFLLFIIPSVLVSISFAPILLSISPTPAFESTKRMTLKQLYAISPLGMVGIFLLGGVFAAQFGMAAVYATEAGMTLVQTSIFIAAFYVGALIMQYPLGWISDRVDRRGLVLVVAAGGAAAAVMGVIVSNFWMISFAALVIGGASNPLYSLLIAYTNDFMEVEDMAAASAGLLFINGVGAITGPLIIGYVMQWAGPAAFFALIAGLLTMVSAYAAYRMTQRPAPDVDQTGAYAPLAPQSSPMAMEFAQEYFIDQSEEDE